MKAENEELQKKTAAAAVEAAEQAKKAVESEAIDKIKEQMQEKEKECEDLKTELASVKAELAKSQEALQSSENRYHQLLKMQAVSAGQQVNLNTTAASGAPATKGGGTRMGGKTGSNRNVDIQLVGAQGVGKTSLIEQLIKDHDQAQLARFNEQKQ